jgi:hypothetical protein
MRARSLLSLAVALGAALATAAHASLPYKDGETLVVTGIVTDAQGTPLPGATVVLEGARAGFNVRSFSREKHDAQQVRVVTNEHGEYSLSWTWASYYNHFELQVGEPYKRAGGGAGFLVVDQQDLTPRLRGGSPVVAAVTVKDTTPLVALRAFVAGLSGDRRGAYDTMGRPEQVDRLVLPDGVEETWWYFAAGKSYRFRNDKQLDVTPFDPVQRF